MGNNATRVWLNKRLDGKTALITGSNTGIGKATAKELYRSGARVIMACRDVEKAKTALSEIQKEVGNQENVGELVIKQLNLGSFSSIRQCADEINRQEEKVHFLINNAGIMMCPKGKTVDGYELHFGVNHLGHFLLTCLLLPKIISSAPARIINVSSTIYKQGEIRWDDYNFDKGRYSAIGAYAQSKLANVLFTMELAKKLKDKGVVVYSLHPGVVKTELGRHMDETYFRGLRWVSSVLFGPFFRTPDEGAMTTLYCVLKDDEDFSGCYFSDCKVNETNLEQQHGEAAKKLWNLSSKLVNYDVNLD
ncbi:hypothetical protein O3M35_003300 [Rhynocoris fuscipes]|uniref:Uncharacterized protein n=1 Tax=Rhynocoris fuscipes TaxID=488301 RepID=A0AAW1CML1_9HEMI